jgi:hypothetical protein
MKFLERVKLIERRRVKEKMTNDLPDGPKQAGKQPDDEDEADLDAEDASTLERKLEKEDLDPSGGKTEVKEKNDKKDKDWIQKAVNPEHEGDCTPMTKSTCTPKRKALAKTFKKMGKKRDREITAKDEK